MNKQISRWLDPILLIGLFISIAIGVGMVLTGNDTLSGLTIGFLSTIITLLVDIIARLQKTENSLLEAASLSRILSDKAIGSHLRTIANLYETIQQYNFEHYRKIADLSLDTCKAKLQEIASGSMLVPAAQTLEEYGSIGVDLAKHNIKAIHIQSPDFFRTSDFGKRYFEKNRMAAKRGVQVTRIFALTNDDARRFVETLKEHEKAGIHVLIVRPDRTATNREFVIFDDQILVDLEIDENNKYRRERIIVDSAKVKRAIEEFQHLVAYAKTVKDAITT